MLRNTYKSFDAVFEVQNDEAHLMSSSRGW